MKPLSPSMYSSPLTSVIQRCRTIRRRGVTLMELIASMAIMAILVVGALSMYSIAQSGSNSTQLLRNLNGVSASVKSLYSGQGGYGTASLNATLISAKVVPSDWSTSGTTITHQLNGTVTVTGLTNYFTVAMTSIPSDVCVKLISNSATGWSSVAVGTGAAITTFPVSPSTAVTNCSGTSNTITFTSNG